VLLEGQMAARLANRVGVVTGGGGGIGAGICRAFAREGAAIAVTDLNLEAASRLAAEINAEGGQAAAFGFDVTDAAAVARVADEIEETLGPLEIWVNNAGISHVVPFLDLSEELWDLELRVNLKGAFIGCQVAIRCMLPRRRGVVLNMSSQSGKIGASHYAAYCASKFGVIGLTQSLALEFARQGIRVNAICPGVVLTGLWDKQIEDYARKRGLAVDQVRPYLEEKVPVGRLCTAEDVAGTAVFLASDEAAFITGQAVNVSGGLVMD
jgi:NAD(P)-dependent dehydrogenase (short-subunit alcohol dehydrogenase family)